MLPGHGRRQPRDKRKIGVIRVIEDHRAFGPDTRVIITLVGGTRSEDDHVCLTPPSRRATPTPSSGNPSRPCRRGRRGRATRADWVFGLIPRAQYLRIRLHAAAKLHSSPAFGVEFTPLNTHRAPDDIRVRRALNYAIDRRESPGSTADRTSQRRAASRGDRSGVEEAWVASELVTAVISRVT